MVWKMTGYTCQLESYVPGIVYKIILWIAGDFSKGKLELNMMMELSKETE